MLKLLLARAVCCCVALVSVVLCGCGGSATSGLMPPLARSFPASDLRTTAQLALTPQVVTQTPVLTETAVPADRFVDSIGVNTHFTYGPYNSRFPAVKSALMSLGVRHIRDGVSNYTAQWSHLRELAAVGIHATVSVGENQSMDDVVDFPAHVPGSVEAIEGPNEPNNTVNWAPKLRAFQHLLYYTVKHTPGTANIAVVGPALGLWRGTGDYEILGDISADMDYGNIHDYFGGNYPDVGVIPWILTRAPQESGTKPIIASETGYCTSSGVQGVPKDVQGDYIPRLFFDQYLNGIKRSLDFSLVDDDTGSSNPWLNCGLLEHDLTPKPSYVALKNLISVLSDRGPSFAPTRLSFSLSDTRRDVHHMLLQKRDGSFYLALWLDTSEYDQTNRRELGVPSRPITVRFGQYVRSVSYNRIRPDGSMFTQNVPVRGQLATILNADSVGVLHIMR